MSTPTTTDTTETTETTEAQDVRSRMPNPLAFFPALVGIAQGLNEAVYTGAVPTTTITLMHLRAGQILGSTYFTVRDAETLRRSGESEQRITAVATWQNAPYFSDAERIALELTEAVLTPNPSGERVSDELHARAAAHYDDKALWTLVMAIGLLGFFTPAALIAKPIPGKPAGQNYSA